MSIKRTAIAGTLESSDIQISIAKGNSTDNEIILDSPVKHLFGEEIEKVIRSLLAKHQLTGVCVKAVDKGALNCTIVARMQAAIYRATENEINWELE